MCICIILTYIKPSRTSASWISFQTRLYVYVCVYNNTYIYSTFQNLCKLNGLKTSGTIGQLANRLLTAQEKHAKRGAKRGLASSAKENPETENKTQKKRKKRVGPTREREKELWGEGYELVAGVDEAGRGPLAGPVVAAAVILPKGDE